MKIKNILLILGHKEHGFEPDATPVSNQPLTLYHNAQLAVNNEMPSRRRLKQTSVAG